MARKRRAAIGFKVHTGWAAVVAVVGPVPEVLAKTRIQVAWTFDEGAVFHMAQELSIAKGRALVRRSEKRFVELASGELRTFVRSLAANVVAGAVVWGKPKALPPFETIVKAHPLVHAAEADLYRRIFAQASEAVLDAQPLRVPGAELTARARSALRLSEAKLASRVAAMGKASGRPWTVDQKEAALAAWLALA